MNLRTDRPSRDIHSKSRARLRFRRGMPLESALELDDIQSAVLRPRPTPYQATYVIFRIDDRKAGRELMRRLSSVVASAADPTSPIIRKWEPTHDRTTPSFSSKTTRLATRHHAVPTSVG